MQNFNYHSHTYRCMHADMDMSDEEYIQEYIKMGFKKIAFTDQCPEKNVIDDRPKIRMKYSQKDEYIKSINILKDKYRNKIKIESGFEVEFMPGDEKNILELKNDSDKIIIGQHFIYDDNKKLKIFSKAECTDEELYRYGEYIKKSMELKIADIIAHPDIFLYRRPVFGEVEEAVTRMICEAAEKYNVPLEINLNYIFGKTYFENKKYNNDSFEEQVKKLGNVVYPRKEFWNIVSEYDIKTIYGLDTHRRGQIMLFNELVDLANIIIGEETINKLNFVEDL